MDIKEAHKDICDYCKDCFELKKHNCLECSTHFAKWAMERVMNEQNECETCRFECCDFNQEPCATCCNNYMNQYEAREDEDQKLKETFEEIRRLLDDLTESANKLERKAHELRGNNN